MTVMTMGEQQGELFVDPVTGTIASAQLLLNEASQALPTSPRYARQLLADAIVSIEALAAGDESCPAPCDIEMSVEGLMVRRFYVWVVRQHWKSTRLMATVETGNGSTADIKRATTGLLLPTGKLTHHGAALLHAFKIRDAQWRRPHGT